MLFCMRYLHLDVFTDRPFEGNQLAVFPAPDGLTPAAMQTIAREMNFSESTFIFPAEGKGDLRMRIFTPGEELPMAGHPTIGTTFALAAEGTIARGRSEFVFELGVGPTPVALEWKGNELAFAWMTQQLPVFSGVIADRKGLAAAVGVTPQDLAADLPIQVVSCGVPFLFVPMSSKEAVDSVAIDRRALQRCFREAAIQELPVFFFTILRDAQDQPERSRGAASESVPGAAATAYSRMLAAGFGIAEDPATGGASGPLGCYLLHHYVVTPEAARSLLSLQGFAMGRPSRIHIAIDSSEGRITRVRVGGKAVLVGTGELHV